MNKKKLYAGLGLITGLSVLVFLIVAFLLARRLDPYIREQAIQYLQLHFESEVELATLRVRLPNISALRLLLTHGRGAFARVEAEGTVLRHKGRRDVPPMFAMKKFVFRVDIGKLFDEPKTVPHVDLEGMEITIPPKGDRPKLGPLTFGWNVNFHSVERDQRHDFPRLE